jgi:hypothetical protein
VLLDGQDRAVSGGMVIAGAVGMETELACFDAVRLHDADVHYAIF